VRELENAIVYAVALCANDCITLDVLPKHIAALVAAKIPDTKPPDFENSFIADRPTMDELQRRYLQFVLDEVQGNRRRAAETLGLNRRTIQRLLARYKLAPVADSEAGEDDNAL
jgi:DNA-binding NtrC family response regulator